MFPIAILFLIHPNHSAAQQNKREPSAAMGTLIKAAEQGDAKSQYELGMMYDHGMGVTQDYAEAVKWYRKAAEQGLADAQFNLGVMHEDGEGVTQDYAEAMKWYRKAADQGHAPAQINLGGMYYKGKGVTQDYVQAHMWLNLSAAAPKGQMQELAAQFRDEIAKKMTPDQIAEAQRLAREWKPKKGK